jgi:hypothetical protein
MKRLFLLGVLGLSAPVGAGINDPWFLAYQVSGGTLTQYKGPYRDRIACMNDRFSIPVGARFLGCYQ